MTPDPALDAIRRARRQISSDCHNDVARLIEHYRGMQADFKGRVIPGPESTPEQPTVSTEHVPPEVRKRSSR